MKVTVPAAPQPLGLTVAVKVTGSPNVDGSTEVASKVKLAARPTVNWTKSLAFAYCAVSFGVNVVERLCGPRLRTVPKVGE